MPRQAELEFTGTVARCDLPRHHQRRDPEQPGDILCHIENVSAGGGGPDGYEHGRAHILLDAILHLTRELLIGNSVSHAAHLADHARRAIVSL